MRKEVLCATTSSAQACAQGYNHTYFANQDLNLQALATLPSDEEINAAAASASRESVFLIGLLGVHAVQLYNPAVSLLNLQAPHFKDINSSSQPFCNPLVESKPMPTDDTESNPSEAEEIQNALCSLEQILSNISDEAQEQVSRLACAAAAMTIYDMTQVYVKIYLSDYFIA
jgi:hypothetical protein